MNTQQLTHWTDDSVTRDDVQLWAQLIRCDSTCAMSAPYTQRGTVLTTFSRCNSASISFPCIKISKQQHFITCLFQGHVFEGKLTSLVLSYSYATIQVPSPSQTLYFFTARACVRVVYSISSTPRHTCKRNTNRGPHNKPGHKCSQQCYSSEAQMSIS